MRKNKRTWEGRAEDEDVKTERERASEERERQCVNINCFWLSVSQKCLQSGMGVIATIFCDFLSDCLWGKCVDFGRSLRWGCQEKWEQPRCSRCQEQQRKNRDKKVFRRKVSRFEIAPPNRETVLRRYFGGWRGGSWRVWSEWWPSSEGGTDGARTRDMGPLWPRPIPMPKGFTMIFSPITIGKH